MPAFEFVFASVDKLIPNTVICEPLASCPTNAPAGTVDVNVLKDPEPYTLLLSSIVTVIASLEIVTSTSVSAIPL